MLEFLDSSFCPNFVKADIERSKINKNFQDDLESNIDIASQQPDWMNALRPDMQYEDTVEVGKAIIGVKMHIFILVM